MVRCASLHGIDGETMETVTDVIFLGSKITADGDCSQEIKRRLLLGLTMQKALTVWTTTNCGKFLNRWENQTA